MILIADSGATKTQWCLFSDTGHHRIKTQGISPYFHTTNQIREILEAELLPSVRNEWKIKEIYYYGTGCTAPLTSKVVADALVSLFPGSSVQVAYDLVAAAHALCGHEKGIACILGTGSNSGYYNGSEIEKNLPGLGYILGDEGSGAYLGKMLSCQYLYGWMDATLSEKFEKEFGITKDSLLSKIYTSPLANRFLAAFSPFLSANRGHHDIEKILAKGLGDFFSVHLSDYSERHSVPVHFTGSVAWSFKDVLKQLCDEYGLQCGKIIKEPMDSLLTYYQHKFNML